jgi:type II secretory pathway component GspD/PulD (secretin)
VLFLDFSVRSLDRKKLGELGIGTTPIQIETRILTVSDAFMKHVGLDPNSVATSEGWSDYLVQASTDSASFVIDQLIVDLLLRATMAHRDSKTIVEPRVLVRDGKKMQFQVPDSRPVYMTAPHEPNGPSGEPEPRRIELGTTIRLTPHLTPDGRSVHLDFEWERRRLLGFMKYTGPDKQTQKIPQVAVDGIKTSCPVPDGKTLLLAGKRITEQTEILPKVPLLGDLPLIGGLFNSPTKVEQTSNLLILVKPVINPPGRVQARHATEPPRPLDPDDPLIKKLEERLKRSDEQK